MDSIAGPSYENIPMRPNGGVLGTHKTQTQEQGEDDTTDDTEAGVLPHTKASKGRGNKIKSASSEQHRRNDLKRSSPEKKWRVHVERRPPTIPILLPEHRYCTIDEIVKPFRTHHCRSCGTVRF